MIVSLDAEAFNALAGPDSPRKQHVRRVLRSAQRLGRPVLVPSLVLARITTSRSNGSECTIVLREYTQPPRFA